MQKNFLIQSEIFTEVIIYKYFLQETQLLLVSVRLQTLVLFFLCFSGFCEFQCPFYKNTIGIFYFILAWRENHKIENILTLNYSNYQILIIKFTYFQKICNKKIAHSCNHAQFFKKHLIETNLRKLQLEWKGEVCFAVKALLFKLCCFSSILARTREIRILNFIEIVKNFSIKESVVTSKFVLLSFYLHFLALLYKQLRIKEVSNHFKIY